MYINCNINKNRNFILCVLYCEHKNALCCNQLWCPKTLMPQSYLGTIQSSSIRIIVVTEPYYRPSPYARIPTWKQAINNILHVRCVNLSLIQIYDKMNFVKKIKKDGLATDLVWLNWICQLQINYNYVFRFFIKTNHYWCDQNSYKWSIV